MTSELSAKMKGLPRKSGVYLFKDEHDKVLYVGKAKNLKSRVGSYFNDRHLDRPWIAVMMGLVRDVETIVVNNELEALILEASLIGEYQPKFNIKLTDDKSYPYIKLTIKDPFPRLQIVRQRTKDGSKYFGPYLSTWSARLTCEFLRRLYGVHISNRPLAIGQDRPCLNCQLEDNLCPQADQIDTKAYATQVSKVIEFLQGKRQSVVKDLDQRMVIASERQNYELAAKLRDQLAAVRQIVSPQDIASGTDEDCNVIAAASTNQRTVITLAPVRSGHFGHPQQFVFDSSADQSESEIIRQFIMTFYHTLQSIPALVILEAEIEDQEIIAGWLSNIFGKKIELRTAKRGEKLDFVTLAKKNAQAKLESLLVNESGDYTGLIALKELLGLSELPQRIEAVDISNLGASEPVGATICFIDGKPDKNEYRRYKIKTVSGQSDFHMIKEVVARRFADTSRPLPDLFVVDGGPMQLLSAMAAVTAESRIKNQESRTAPLFISLAKKPDRIFLPGKKRPVITKRGHKGILFLARIRDEVHRYVIGYHRYRQRRRSLSDKRNALEL